MNTYISAQDYIRADSGHDTSTVTANVTHIASPGISAGATTIPLLAPTTTLINQYETVSLFDGSASEQVQASAMIAQGATSLTVTATAYAHAAGIALCTDGSQGSLANMIFTASAEMERYCRQPLLYASYSSERLPLRTMRAAVTRDYTLVLRPKRFPVQSVSAVSAQLNASTTLNLAVSEAFIDADQQVVTLAQMTSTGGSMTFWGNISPPLRQTTPGWISLSYSAGYAYAALPYELHQAAIWLVSDLLSDRRNPTGAAEQQLGKEHIVSRLRGDTSGKSVLAIRAYENLEPYRQKPF